MKKVLAIAPYPFLPYYSGGQKFIAQFFHFLGKKTDLTVISVPGNDFSLAHTYKTISLLKPGSSRYYDFSLIRKISALVKENNFDTIIWEHPYYAWLAFRIRKRTGVQTFIHTHNIEYQRFRSMGKWWWRILRFYERRAFRKADGIFFITPEDKRFAIDNWKINPNKSIGLPFGIENDSFPSDRQECRKEIAEKYNIAPGDKILFFNGLLNYKPNLDALKVILDDINPRLMKANGFRYKIIICGMKLPGTMNELKSYSDKNVIYEGFTNRIDVYCKASDLLLNPVQAGGGVKTKMVEAIGYGTTVIATNTGATGMDPSICGNKLVILPDNDWDGFTTAILNHSNNKEITSSAFYQYYYWERIIDRITERV